MLKSNEFKILSKRFAILISALTVFFIGFCFISKNFIQEYFYSQVASETFAIINKHPELEKDFIFALKNMRENSEEGQIILEKYGITNSNIMELDKNIEYTIYIFVFSIFIFLLITITIFYLLHLRKIYKKLDKINEYINAILNDEYPINLKEYKEGAFSTLKNDIYKITNKLRDQKDLLETDKLYLESTLSDISHQLKTPLTSMYVINNLLKDDKLDSHMREEFLRKNKLQLERIEWLVTSLLKLSKLESGTIKLKSTKIKIEDIVLRAIEPLKISIELKKQDLIVEGDKNTTVFCDVNWTIEAFVNIIKNAYEHTDTNGVIKISWSDNPIYTSLCINDNGNGIDPSDINHIFERFYKGSHNSKESIGIGLNMTKQILVRQGFAVDVESKLDEGTTFTIKFFKHKF